jgi:hypothetical protein
MSSVAEIEEAAASLPPKEFARLLEDLRDLEIARTALAEIDRGNDMPISLDELEVGLGL